MKISHDNYTIINEIKYIYIHLDNEEWIVKKKDKIRSMRLREWSKKDGLVRWPFKEGQSIRICETLQISSVLYSVHKGESLS